MMSASAAATSSRSALVFNQYSKKKTASNGEKVIYCNSQIQEGYLAVYR